MKNTRFAVQYRRKREGRTDYKKRVKLLISGKARAVVRRSLKNITIQLVAQSEKGDKVLASATSTQLAKHGWKHGVNICTSYLTGYLCGQNAKAAKVTEAILDTGNYQHVKGGRIYAALKGLVDSGISIAHEPSIFPSKDRLEGKHIKPEIAKEMEAVKQKLGQEQSNSKQVKQNG